MGHYEKSDPIMLATVFYLFIYLFIYISLCCDLVVICVNQSFQKIFYFEEIMVGKDLTRTFCKMFIIGSSYRSSLELGRGVFDGKIKYKEEFV